MSLTVKISALLLVILTGITFHESIAQHEHHGHNEMKSTEAEPHSMEQHDTMQHNMTMTHAYSLSLPMTRNGSGTSWQPDNTPMYAYMWHSRSGWNYMLHGNIFIRQNWQNFNNDYKRGGKQFDVPNWFMGMAQRQVGRNGLFNATAMLSLDRLVMDGNGYPLLFQSGESWEDKPLIDRQHPHDFLAALSVAYTHRINNDIDITAYLGYPGEPALGPPAFMHRISALSNPDAPLGHHWQDASHIVWGVGTIGFRYKWLKAEGSIFTGREPDEDRYGFDKPLFDSYSWRLMANPTKDIALQVSQGYIKSPEALKPDEDVIRTTASAIYNKPLGSRLMLSNALVWGLNNAGHGHVEHSILAESNAIFGKNMLYGRYEWVQKSAEELGLEHELGHDAIEPINVLTLGYSRTILTFLQTNIAAGGQISIYKPSGNLENFYGNTPLSGQIYFRLTPQRMKM